MSGCPPPSREGTPMTRKRWIASISLPIAVVIALPLIAAAGTSSESPTRHFSGTTAQGRPIDIKAVETADGWAVQRIDVGIKVRCENDAKFPREASRTFDPPIALDDKHRFAIDDVDLT